MKKKKMFLDGNYQEKVIPLSFIQTDSQITDFDKKELKAKAAYILTSGAPVFTVNTQEDGKFTLLSSPEDYFACVLAEVREVKARVYAFTSYQAEIFGIVQKIKTQKLSALEEGYLMQRLVKEFSFTQDDVAALIGKSRPAVANALRLLSLTPPVLERVRKGELSAGHARAILTVKDPKKQAEVAQKISALGLSVRQAELLCKNLTRQPVQTEYVPLQVDYISECEKDLSKILGRGVRIVNGKRKGRFELEFYGPEDLQLLLDALMKIK